MDQSGAHRGADGGHILAGLKDAQTKGGHAAVHAAGAHRGSLIQAQLQPGLGGEAAHDVPGLYDARGHHRAGDPHVIHQLVRPAVCIHIEDTADIACGRVVDRHLPGKPIDDIVVGREKETGTAPVVRFVVPYPEDLQITVIGVGAVVGDTLQFFRIDVFFHPALLNRGPAIHPDQAGAYGFHLLVQRDAGAAVESADADTGHVGRGYSGFLHRIADGALCSVQPHIRPLLGPKRLGGEHVVFLEILGDEPALRIHKNGFGARGTDVGTDKVFHHALPIQKRKATLKSPYWPEARSKAVFQSSREKTLLTTPRVFSVPSAMWSMT